MSLLDVLKWFFEVAGINKRKIVVLIALLIILNVALYYSYPLVRLTLSNPILRKVLAHVLVSVLATTAFGSVLFILSKPMLKVKLGVYWDSMLNPYCTKCKIPLSGSQSGSNVLRCPNCKEDFTLRFGAQLLSLDEAVNKIRNKDI
jgi:hypothetical protein